MKHSLFPLGLFLLWLGSYIGYPLWYLPQEELRGMVFVILLIFFAINFLAMDRFVDSLKLDGRKQDYISIKKEKIIWWSGIIYFLLQIYPMTLPVIPRGDEELYLTSSLVYYLKLSSFWESLSRIPLHWCAWLLLFLLVFTIKRSSWRDFLMRRKSLVFWVLLLASVIYYFIFKRYVSLDSFYYLFRYPFFSKFFYIVAYSLFGIREFGPRIVPAIFGFLSAIYLYKLVSLYRSREIALFSFIFWLFMPACLFFGNLAFLVNGISFFFIASFYYLLSFHKDKSSHSFFLGIFILSVGTMYQQPLIVALFIYYLYLLSQIINKKVSIVKEKAVLILPAWAVLVTALPYLILTIFIYNPRPYPIQELSIGVFLRQLSFILSGLSAVHLFFLISGIAFIVKKRDDFSFFCVLWFAVYFFFRLFIPIAERDFRLVVPYFPAMAILMAEGAGWIAGKKKMLRIVVILILVYSLLSSTVWIVPPLSPKLVLYHDIHSRYLPYPEAILYLKNNLGPGERYISLGHSNPIKFYSHKFGLPISQVLHAVWETVELQTADNFYEYAESNKIKFCLFPSGDWPKGFLNPKLRDRLVRGEDERFMLDKIFYFGKNKLYLLRII